MTDPEARADPAINAGVNSEGSSVVLPANCTVRAIDLAFDAVLQAIPASDVVHFDCSGVEQADLSLVQLLVSAQRTFSAKGLRLVLDAASPPVLSAFDRSGVPWPGSEHRPEPEEHPWLPC